MRSQRFEGQNNLVGVQANDGEECPVDDFARGAVNEKTRSDEGLIPKLDRHGRMS